MAYRAQTIDDLLADSLIQKVMLADHVEPQALKTLLDGTARRITEFTVRGHRTGGAGSRPARLVSRTAPSSAAHGTYDGRRMRSIALRLTLFR